MDSVRNLIAIVAAIMILSIPAQASFPDEWTRDPANPVFVDGIPSTVVFTGGHYEMWGSDGSGFSQGTSPDGRTWTINEASPVLVPGPGWYDEMTVDHASVQIVDGLYHMWYSCTAADGHNRIAHATSSDGLDWTKDPANPVLDLGPPGSLDSAELIHPCVLFEDPVLHIWYNGHDDEVQRILHATSLDGITWSRDATPALEPGQQGAWDDEQLGMMSVVPYGGFYHMLYTGWGADEVIQIGFAASANGLDWIKWRTDEPVFEPGPEGSWDDLAVLLPVVLVSDSGFMMWYGGTRDFESFSTGLATAVFAPTTVPDAAALALGPNYPNPFNPSTTIQYTLAETAMVTLTIHDAAGHQVRELMTSRLVSDGRHEVRWDGRDAAGRAMPAGVYYARLEAGSTSETRSMVLVK